MKESLLLAELLGGMIQAEYCVVDLGLSTASKPRKGSKLILLGNRWLGVPDSLSGDIYRWPQLALYLQFCVAATVGPCGSNF